MVDASLYDKRTEKQAEISRADISAADIQRFCDMNHLQFHAMGCPEGAGGEGWSDTTVFRAATHTVPARGVTVKLDTVLEWTRARQQIGAEKSEGGVYLYHEGGLFTTQCEAKDVGTGKRLIVYKDESGKAFARPWEEFFTVVKGDGGRLVARYALMYARPNDQGENGTKVPTRKVV